MVQPRTLTRRTSLARGAPVTHAASTPQDYFTQLYPDFRQGFAAMRGAARAAGPLDLQTQEIINTINYAISQSEHGTKTHATRAYQAGVSPAGIRQALLLCVGLGLGFAHVVTALDWVRQALEAAGATE